MALFIPSGSGGYENASFPLTAYPIVMAAWATPLALPVNNSASALTSIGKATAARNDLQIGMVTLVNVTSWSFRADNGTTFENIVIASPKPAIGTAAFVIGRFISATNRRISILQNGVIAHASSSTNITMVSSFTRSSILFSTSSSGAFQYTGSVQNMWWADADLYDSAQNLPDTIVYQLAYQGPLSLPAVARTLVDYRPFHANTDQNSTQNTIGTYVNPKYGGQRYTATGSGFYNGQQMSLPMTNGYRPLTHPPVPSFKSAAAAAALFGEKFRTTASPIGTRAGSRQVWIS